MDLVLEGTKLVIPRRSIKDFLPLIIIFSIIFVLTAILLWRLGRWDTMAAMRYFEGPSSVTAIFNDVVEHSKRGDIFYRYTSEKNLDDVNRLLPADYRKRRDAKRLERLVISNPESGSRKRSRLERFIKFLGSSTDADHRPVSAEKELFHQNAIQLIYGDRIALIDLNTHIGLIIENKTLAEFQKTIFRALYKRL